MKVPHVITLQLMSAPLIDLSEVIVVLTVSTGQRNPRRVYFPKTDDRGRSALERDDFLGQFADATEEDIMGSWGTVDDASGSVRVTLYDPTPILNARELALAWTLFKHEQKKWPSRAAEYEYRSSCRNPLFTATPIVVDLHAGNHIEFWVAPAEGHAG